DVGDLHESGLVGVRVAQPAVFGAVLLRAFQDRVREAEPDIPVMFRCLQATHFACVLFRKDHPSPSSLIFGRFYAGAGASEVSAATGTDRCVREAGGWPRPVSVEGGRLIPRPVFKG